MKQILSHLQPDVHQFNHTNRGLEVKSSRINSNHKTERSASSVDQALRQRWSPLATNYMGFSAANNETAVPVNFFTITSNHKPDCKRCITFHLATALMHVSDKGMDENGYSFSICPCFSNCFYLTCHSRKKECCLCWRFLFTSEQNCTCFPCPYEEDKPYQCCHCSSAEHANCWWCCCSCSNDPDCKCCCCSGENSACQYYASKCCRNPISQEQSRSSATAQSKDVMSIFRTRNNAFVKTPERNASNHAFRDQLACPLCKQLFLQPFMLPCNHCICEKCITKSKTKAEATDNFYIIVCPVCSKAHCLPYTNKIQLRKNYLRAKLAKKYMRRHGILRWRFDHSERPVHCDICREGRRMATKRCKTCGINMCNECLHLYHSENGAQDHIFTKADQDNEQWPCLLHCNSHLSEYCLDDHKLICRFCKNSLHNDHETIPLAAACSKEATSLSSTIVKFKQARQGVDNNLMEVILLKNNFQTYKDAKRKEIRNGFLKLRMVLHEQEKEMMELLENIELKKQKEISEYVNYTSKQLSYMDGLIQYAEEALKEESQIVFLQSAHCLVKEIEDAILSIFHPSPLLREDPLRKLQLNFDELFAILQGLVPSLREINRSDSKAEKNPYLFNPEIMLPMHVSSTHEDKQATLLRSTSLNSVFESGTMIKNTPGRQPSSMPPHHSTQSNNMCAFWDAACETPTKERKYQFVNLPSPEPIEKLLVPVPGHVVIYQTVVYPRSAKIYWTCPIEDVDFFEVEFYEVVGIGSDNIVQTQLDGQLSKIQQQNLEIRNLDPNTEYLFKVRAVNKSGEGEWSEICKITTSDEHRIIQDRWGIQKSMQGALHTPK